MNTIVKIAVLACLCLIMGQAQAQDTLQNQNNQQRIERLKLQKERVSDDEKALLKIEVEQINKQFENGEITRQHAEDLKIEKAKRRALNIENRIIIIDNEMALLQRNDEFYKLGADNKNEFSIDFH